MGDSPRPNEEDASAGPQLYDSGDLSTGGQIYTNTEIGKYFYNGLHYLSAYGWYVVLVAVCVGIAWVKLAPTLGKWWKKRRDREEELNFDPAKAEKYQDGMLRAREKMQRELNEKAVVHQEETAERAAQERDEKIQQWETFGVAHKSKKPKPKSDTPPPPRRQYFPMSGQGGGGGGGGGYRPARRNVRGGGG